MVLDAGGTRSSASPGKGDWFAKEAGCFPRLIGTGEPIQQVFQNTGEAVVVFRDKEPYPIRPGDCLPDLRHRQRHREFHILIKKGNLRVIEKRDLSPFPQHFLGQLGQLPLERFLPQGANYH